MSRESGEGGVIDITISSAPSLLSVTDTQFSSCTVKVSGEEVERNIYIVNNIEDLSYVEKSKWGRTVITENTENEKNLFLVKDTKTTSSRKNKEIPLYYYLYSPLDTSSITKMYVDEDSGINRDSCGWKQVPCESIFKM